MYFIDEDYLNDLLQDDNLFNRDMQKDVIKKSLSGEGLTLRESTSLLNIQAPDLLDQLFAASKNVKEKIFGRRIVLSAPLYTSNSCSDSCLYCPFRRNNVHLKKKILSPEEIGIEAENIIKQGHKRILVVTGADEVKKDIDYIRVLVETISALNINGSSVRQINIKTAPLSIEHYTGIKNTGIASCTCFQETYHFNTYRKMHNSQTENDFGWRLYNADRAFEAGINNINIGALFGLTDYKFETLALLQHANYLENRFGSGPHSVSIPRLKPINNSPASSTSAHAVDNISFRKLASVIRLSLPFTGIIISSREKAALRRELFSEGITDAVTAGNTLPFLYKESSESLTRLQVEEQQEADLRSLDEIVRDIIKAGCIPSFCTACNILNRPGEMAAEMAKTGRLISRCESNALSSLKEYSGSVDDCDMFISDYITKTVSQLKTPLKKQVTKMIERVAGGEKDVII